MERRVRGLIRRSSAYLLAIAVAGAGLLSVAKPAYARVVYTYSDQVSSIELPQTKPYMDGRHMVWLEEDEAGYRQVVYQSLDGTVKKRITDLPTPKDPPKVGEADDGSVYIVWGDKRHLFAHELQSGRQWKVYESERTYDSFAMNGADVVTNDPYTHHMMHYDLKRGTATDIGEGSLPVVAEGKVLFRNRDGGLSLHVLATGETRPAVVPEPYSHVARLTFNGTYALYRQDDANGRSKYVMLDTTNPQARPIDLTPATRKTTEYYQLYIGDTNAAWVQETTNGSVELKGVNLQRAETHTIARGDEAMRVLTFRDDQLLHRTADGYLAYRAIVRTEVSDGGFFLPAPAEPDTYRSRIGKEGGELAAKDGSVKLRIPAGALAQEAEIELKLNRERTETLATPTALGTLRPASKAWDVVLADGLNGSATLTFGYEPGKWTDLQTRKMALYRWDDAGRTWKRVAGQLDATNRSVSVPIAASGTYALFVNDVTFTDTGKHWAQAYVEILASRDIVSGVDEGRFAPDDTLTRAQFTKMLLGALGIAPEPDVPSPFADVPSSHWSAGWVAAAAAKGLVQGDGDRFDPDAELTREQMMAMLVRAIDDEAKANALSEAEIESSLAYTDAREISGWAKAYAAIASKSGLIEGDGGMIRPKQPSTRAQAAAVVYRLLQRIENNK